MDRFWRCVWVCGLAAACAGVQPPGARAEHTRFWRQSNYEEFEKGTPKGVALRSDGKLVLAPRFAQFADPNTAYLWSLRLDSKGNLYAAGGSNAKVLRLDDKGQATVVFESQEMAAQALAIDAQDNLYVGTSPDGKVYRVTPRGERSVFFEPKTKYIWDLAVDPAGNVYVATGDKGEIFVVTPEGKGQVYYKSEETHVRALAFDSKGNLLFGSDPHGLIVRVEKAASSSSARTAAERAAKAPADSAPQAFVIYETAKKEVTSLLVDRSGNLFAAAVGEKLRPAQPAPPLQGIAPQVTAPVIAAQATVGVPAQAPQQPAAFIPFPPLTGGGAVYRIGPDGAPDQVWSSPDELVYALALSPAGRLLLGTGNRGLIIQLEGSNLFSSLAKTAAAQVTGLLQGTLGKVYLCTANPGKVFTLGPDYESEGTFESQTFDAKIFSQWGRVSWWGENLASGTAVVKEVRNPPVALYVRSGNTSDPEKNWSAWSGPYTNPNGERITGPPARFVQWKAVFRTPSPADRGSTSETPEISWVSVAYLPKNVAPTIESILLQNPGVRVQSFAAPAQPQQQQPVQLRLPQTPPPGQPGVVGVQHQPPQPQRFEAPPQGLAQKGYQSVIWSARDENDDDLVFNLYYRGEDEKNWKLLKSKIEQKFYSWDTSTMPDGAYYLKIAASDAPSNPPDEALTAERESDRFEVDNTPPWIEGLRAEPASPDVRVRFTARDSYSRILRAEYSLDADEWTLVFPTERTSDSPVESYELALRALAGGEHTLAVRVYDQFENSSSSKVTFTIAPAKER